MSDSFLNPPSRKRAALLQAAGGYINTTIVIVQGLLMIPLYLKFIGIHTYGLWLASGGILGMMGLVNFGVSSLLIQRVAKSYGQQDLARAGAYFLHGIFVYLGICLLFGMAALIISLLLPGILSLDNSNRNLLQGCFQLAAVAMVIGVFNECLRSFAQALLRPVMPMIGMVVGRILGIVVTVWLLFDDLGLWAIPIGTLVTEVMMLLVNAVYSARLFGGLQTRIKFELKIFREYLKSGPALLLARVGTTLSQDSEPLIITLIMGPEMTTVYVVMRRAADIVFRMLSVIVASVMGPFSHLVGSGDRELTNRVCESLLLLSFTLAVVGFATYLGANEIFVMLWVGSDYLLPTEVVTLVAIGFLVYSLRGLLGRLIYAFGDFNFTSVIILLEGILKVLLAVGCMSLFGIVGAPLAFLIAGGVGSLILGWRLKSHCRNSLSVADLGRLVAAALAVFIVSVLVAENAGSLNNWVAFAILLVVLVVVSVATMVLTNYRKAVQVYATVRS